MLRTFWRNISLQQKAWVVKAGRGMEMKDHGQGKHMRKEVTDGLMVAHSGGLGSEYPSSQSNVPDTGICSNSPSVFKA